ncbi:Plant UBX domain-containing protein 8 [Striga hermonthica]|uniref:Plant UBX domain-containing protein 8 n=1 Tax=Striga hermonthica TaxID=68872 RepID=A0A9N7RN70_STRHE|nr:Plant UBX domain-containing protein 8 [Striga hermonthica]
MATPDQEAIDTFMNITGVDEATAIRKLEDHHGNLNAAVNAHFGEGDQNLTQETSFAAPQDDMEIDDPQPFESRRPISSPFPFARDLNPFSLLDPNFTRNIFGIGSAPAPSPFVSHPREVREIPIEVKDGIGASSQSGGALRIEDVTETAREHGPEIRGMVIIDDEVDERSSPNSPITQAVGHGTGGTSTNYRPSAPTVIDVPDYGDEIEEEMIRAAIEASKQGVRVPNQLFDDHLGARDPSSQQGGQSHQEDAELARAVSLSLQEIERQLAAKEASLPQEPTADDENAVTLLVRMPDGNRRGRRFLKSDKLQCLFDFIDVGKAVKPGSYRLVRPYPRRAFSDGDSTSSLHDLGLTSKQEALYLELI